MFAREADEFLATNAEMLASCIRSDIDGPKRLQRMVEVEFPARQYARLYARVLDASGRKIAETEGMATLLPADLFPTIGEGLEVGAAQHSPQDQGLRYRLTSRSVEGAKGHWSIQVACSLSHQDDILESCRRCLWIVWGVSFPLCIAIGFLIAAQGMHRIRSISDAARRIGSSTLHDRISTADLPSEIREMVQTFNEMLDRLEHSFQRLSQFSFDIAHELRTPIGNMRGAVEVAMGRQRSPEEYREVLETTLEECERLSTMVERMLFICRAERAETQLVRKALRLHKEFSALLEAFEPMATDVGVTVLQDVSDGLVLCADRELLHSALGNLLSNAITHTPRGGQVRLSACSIRERVVISVADTGCGISPEHLPHVCERFYRTDSARSSGVGGMGLGLAIVRTITDLHGGSLHVSSQEGRGTTVTIELPSGT